MVQGPEVGKDRLVVVLEQGEVVVEVVALVLLEEAVVHQGVVVAHQGVVVVHLVVAELVLVEVPQEGEVDHLKHPHLGLREVGHRQEGVLIADHPHLLVTLAFPVHSWAAVFLLQAGLVA